MSTYSASIDRQHERNQKPGIAFTFLCTVCRIHKTVIGRKLHSTFGVYRRKYQCAVCAAVAKEVA